MVRITVDLLHVIVDVLVEEEIVMFQVWHSAVEPEVEQQRARRKDAAVPVLLSVLAPDGIEQVLLDL